MRALAALIAAAAVAMAGCTTEEAGTATPGPATRTTSSTRPTEQTPDVPRVNNPLDASRYVADPCAVLTEPTLAAYGVSRTGRPDTTSTAANTTGPSCTWFGQEQANAISVSWQTGNKNGLSDTYSLQEDFETWDQFEATEVDGYPAVFNNFAIEAEHGTCNLVVGTSDTLAFAVLLQGAGSIDGETSCNRVMQVATAVIKMLKENP